MYRPDEDNFKHNGLGGLHGLLAYEVTEVLNEEFELYLEYPNDGRLYEKIETGVQIKAKPNRKDEPHVFRVYDIEMNMESKTISIYAHSNVQDLAANFVDDVAINGLAAPSAFETLKHSALDPVDFTFWTDITTAFSAHWSKQSVLSCIAGDEGSMLQIWGGEIKHGNKQLWLYRRRGRDNVTTIRHGKNLRGLDVTYSSKGLVTAILPYFNYSDDEGVERTIVGDIVYSDLATTYPLTYYDAVEFGEDDGVTDRVSLNAAAGKYFDGEDFDKPSLNVEVEIEELSQTKQYEKFKDFEQVNIGDTFTVYSEQHKVNITAKVYKVVYDGLKDTNAGVEAGTKRASTYDSYRDLIDRSLVPVIEQMHIIQSTADGKNKIFRGSATPPESLVSEGDLWFRPAGEAKMDILVFNGTEWEMILGADVFRKINLAIDGAKEIAKQARDNADDLAEDLRIGTSFFEHANAIGLANKNADGTIDSLISIDTTTNTPYIRGEHIVLDGNTIVDGTFTVTNEMIASGISANKITTGNMHGNRIRANTLDVRAITGAVSDFVFSSWNSGLGGVISIDGPSNAMTVRQSGGWQIRLGSSGMTIFDNFGRRRGMFGGVYNSRLAKNNLFIGATDKGLGGLTVGYQPSNWRESVWGESFTVDGDTGNINVRKPIVFNRDHSSSWTEIIHGSTYLRMYGRSESSLAAANTVGFSVNALSRGGVKLLAKAHLDMAGNDVWNGRNVRSRGYHEGSEFRQTSDARLKTNVSETDRDHLNIIHQQKLKVFDWIGGEKDNLGLIAQDVQKTSSEWVKKNEQGYLSLSFTNILMDALGAIQQLEKRVKELENGIAN